MKKLTTQPYKGSRDFYPEEFRVREYIFSIWRDVCKSYGYQEYDGPFLESFELYAEKSGDELVNEQLYFMEDKGGRKIAIRPEMTPTLARMVSGKYKTLQRPIRFFSIPNLWRYEKPQRGRLREFFQLNVDVLGVESPEADFEILMTAIDIMMKAGAKEGMFELRLNDRRLMNDFYDKLELSQDQISALSKALDKKMKISQSDFEEMLKEGDLEEFIDTINKYIKNPSVMLTDFAESTGSKSITRILELAKDNKIEAFMKFDPTIVRGLAYYTGTVFEQFDLNPDNTRAMFGGGRYDDLVKLFIDDEIPATGFGMGDVTFRDFLESWDLLPDFVSETEYLVTKWEENNKEADRYAQEIAKKLRENGKNTEMWLGEYKKLDKQFKYANKKQISYVIIAGDEELKNNQITVKNMISGDQTTKSFDEFFSEIE